MKTLVTKIVLATSVALGTLVAAGTAYAQPPSGSNLTFGALVSQRR